MCIVDDGPRRMAKAAEGGKSEGRLIGSEHVPADVLIRRSWMLARNESVSTQT